MGDHNALTHLAATPRGVKRAERDDGADGGDGLKSITDGSSGIFGASSRQKMVAYSSKPGNLAGGGFPSVREPRMLIQEVMSYIVSRRIGNPSLSVSSLGEELETTIQLVDADFPEISNRNMRTSRVVARLFDAMLTGQPTTKGNLDVYRDSIFSALRRALPWSVYVTALATLCGFVPANATAPIVVGGRGSARDTLPTLLSPDTPFPPERVVDGTELLGAGMDMVNQLAVGKLVVVAGTHEMLRALYTRYGNPMAENVPGINTDEPQSLLLFRSNGQPAALAVPTNGGHTERIHPLLIAGRVDINNGMPTITVPTARSRTDVSPYRPHAQSASPSQLLETVARTIHALSGSDESFDDWRVGNRATARALGLRVDDLYRTAQMITGYNAGLSESRATDLALWSELRQYPTVQAARDGLLAYLDSTGFSTDNRETVDAAMVLAGNDPNATPESVLEAGVRVATQQLRTNYLGQKRLFSLDGHPFSTEAIEIATAAGAFPWQNFIMFGCAKIHTVPFALVPPSSVVVMHTGPEEQDRQDPSGANYLLEPKVNCSAGVMINPGVESWRDGGLAALYSEDVASLSYMALPAAWLQASPSAGATLRETLRPLPFNLANSAAGILDRRIVGTPSANMYGTPLRVMQTTVNTALIRGLDMLGPY